MGLQAVFQFARDTLVPTLLAHIVLAFALAFVSPRAHNVRLAASAITIAFCMEAIRRCRRDSFEEASFADYMFGLAFHTNCYLVLLNLGPPPDLVGSCQRLQWGVNSLFSPRMGTKPYRQDPPGITKAIFLKRRLVVAIVIGSLWMSIREADHFFPPNIGPQDWQPAKTCLTPQILNGTLTLRDLWFRIVLVSYSHAGSGLVICGAHTICALIAVGIFNSPHQSWPPLFGDITEAYTLRRWYSHFWHKAMRKAFTIHAVVIAEKGLGLRKHTVAGRSTVVLLSFLFSGIMHTVTGWQSGPCENHYSPIRSFLHFGIFILLEQAVQASYFAIHRKLRIPWTRVEMVLWQCLGYLWVAFYMLEFTIGSSFEHLRCVDRVYEI